MHTSPTQYILSAPLTMAFVLDKDLFFNTLDVVYRNTNMYVINRIDEFVEEKKIKIVDKTLLDNDNKKSFNMVYQFPLNVNILQTVMQLVATNFKSPEFRKRHSMGIQYACAFQADGKKPTHFAQAKLLAEQFIREYECIDNIEDDTISYLAGFFE